MTRRMVRISLRLSDAIHELLWALSTETGKSLAELIRECIEEKYAERIVRFHQWRTEAYKKVSAPSSSIDEDVASGQTATCPR